MALFSYQHTVSLALYAHFWSAVTLSTDTFASRTGEAQDQVDSRQCQEPHTTRNVRVNEDHWPTAYTTSAILCMRAHRQHWKQRLHCTFDVQLSQAHLENNSDTVSSASAHITHVRLFGSAAAQHRALYFARCSTGNKRCYQRCHQSEHGDLRSTAARHRTHRRHFPLGQLQTDGPRCGH